MMLIIGFVAVRWSASGLAAWEPFELNEVPRKRRNHVAVSLIACIPDRFSKLWRKAGAC